MCLLGFGSGLPFLLVGYVLSIWLREAGYDLGLIGLLSYIGLFYALKFVWAPLVDRYPLPWLGRRRGWLFASQLLLAVGLAGMALLGPGAGLPLFILLAGVAAFAGATQDIAVDAYRIEIAPVEAQGALAATYTLGYRLGLIASTVGVLYVAEFWDWRVAYLAMAALMIPPLLTTLVAREPESTIPLGPRGGFVQAFVGPFVEFFRRNGWVLAVALLAFVGLYKLPDQMLGVIAGPYYLDSGFDKAQIANISKLYGVPIGIAGAFVGGMTVAAIGLRWSLAVAAVAVALSNLLFILMSVHPGELWSFMAAISGDNFSQGFAGTVLVAFMSALANRSYTATQYALLGSLANLPGKLIGGVSGFMVEASSYTAFFIFSTLSIVPTLLLLVWLWPRLAPRSAA
nr:MFS transporter [Arenimonas soli]